MTTTDESAPNEMRRGRPRTESSYGIPDRADGTLPWTFVVDRLRNAQNYWVTTVRGTGRSLRVDVAPRVRLRMASGAV